MNLTQLRTRLKPRYAWMSAGGLAMAVLVACGGGAGTASTAGTSTTSASSSGPITGFGSIFVNGVRIDDSAAVTTLDDDSSGGDADLKLGMMVDVDADTDANGNPAKATAISARSFVQGPISTISVANNQLTLLGMTVTVSPRTVFDGAGVTGLASLNAGDGIEVHGLADATGGVKATRIERKASATTDIRVTGTVQSTDSTSLTINGVKVKYQTANLVNMPNGVVTGMLVRVKGTLSGTDIVASKVREVRYGPKLKENQRTEVDGVVTAFTSATSFEVNGLSVSVPATVQVQGTVARGVRVEVKGQVTNNVLVASKVEVQDESREADDAHELHGSIFSLDVTGKSFTMRDGSLTVKWDSNTTFDPSSLSTGAAGLSTGLRIEIKGKVVGNVLIATSIQIDK